MDSGVRRLIVATTTAAVVLIAAVAFVFPLEGAIGGPVGLVYWVLATLLASALPIRLPRGSVVSVAAPAVFASTLLGGPLAGVIVAAVGSTDAREVRGQVPWFGTLFNHSGIVIAIVAGALTYEGLDRLLAVPLGVDVGGFCSAIAAGAVFSLTNWLLVATAVSTRTRVPIRSVLSSDVLAIAPSMVGLVPLAWLMAQTFQLPNGVGWWATPLFVVPLLATRISYARYVETRELFEQTIEALAKAVDARDVYTRNHSSRVSFIAEHMSEDMRLPEKEIEKIKWAGLLHDVGKIGIRDHILLKEGPLDKHERILMNQHPTIGAEIVAPATQLADEAPLIKAHHEWFNGSGYPDGVEALNIPRGARILTIADAYEAMTSSRPYRKIPLTHEQAVDQLEKFSGIQFDPEIVPVLLGLDRSILDRPPDRPDELPTMLHQSESDQLDAPAAAASAQPQEPRPRPALASDDVS